MVWRRMDRGLKWFGVEWIEVSNGLASNRSVDPLEVFLTERFYI